MTWDEVINSPYLHNLPFKIEQNKFGQILMSPASNKHGIVQSQMGYEIYQDKKMALSLTSVRFKLLMA